MRVIRLQVDNFKRVEAVTIETGDGAVVIGGDNDQGKSSTLDALEWGLRGPRVEPPNVIREGADQARVVIETDEFTLRRTRDAERHRLEIRPKDGSRYGAAKQGALDELLGNAALDPLEFERMKPREQTEALLAALGLDFFEGDAKRTQLFDERTAANREVKRLQGAVDSMPPAPKDAPTEEVSIGALSEEMERRREVNRANEGARDLLAQMQREAAFKRDECRRLQAEADLRQAEFDERVAAGRAQRSIVSGLVDEDCDELLEQIMNCESNNAAARASVKRAALTTALGTAIDESDELSRQITDLDNAKAAAIAGADYPVPGLEVAGDCVMLDGQPFEQAGQAGRLRASMAIGLVQKPELNIMRVKDGSRLDARSMGLVKGLAREAGCQLWIEVVGKSDSATVVIEDGRVLTGGVGT